MLINEITINGVVHPVRSRKDLYDVARDKESFAPVGTVHWWVKGDDDHPYYKCDIHFQCEDDPSDTYSVEGLGDSLAQALEDLKSNCE